MTSVKLFKIPMAYFLHLSVGMIYSKVDKFVSVENQITNTSGLVGHIVSVATTQPWSYSMKVATE